MQLNKPGSPVACAGAGAAGLRYFAALGAPAQLWLSMGLSSLR